MINTSEDRVDMDCERECYRCGHMQVPNRIDVLDYDNGRENGARKKVNHFEFRCAKCGMISPICAWYYREKP